MFATGRLGQHPVFSLRRLLPPLVDTLVAGLNSFLNLSPALLDRHHGSILYCFLDYINYCL